MDWRRVGTFIVINFANDGLPIDRKLITPSVGELELLSLRIPLFDNITSALETSAFRLSVNGGVSTEYELFEGHYNVVADLISALNDNPSIEWVFEPRTKRIVVSSTGGEVFEIEDCRLINLVLGFDYGAIDGTSNTYTSAQIVNLFPYSHYVVDSNKISVNASVGESNSSSLAIPVASFDFLGARAITFDKNSMYRDAVLPFDGPLFPMRIKMSILMLDGAIEQIPYKPTERFSIGFLVKPPERVTPWY